LHSSHKFTEVVFTFLSDIMIISDLSVALTAATARDSKSGLDF